MFFFRNDQHLVPHCDIQSAGATPVGGGRERERPVGEHLGFGRQGTKMDESCETKGEG